ncbi:hypothetical protein [Nocardia sp. CS682]|uniref:hypothetical protein n=1 Tax=Nocardia sp. CS682 TaxID=1047172 RepID=UPI0010754443|nr:hypothetical protein [Nocardia sp. CS682]QBS43637.1 hypothetical protein DMB37_29565 [Nocardia sp. CS682]
MLFTGIVLLFGRKGRPNLQTIALLSAAFLALSLDSYLFSLVTGIRPVVLGAGVSTEACMQAWAQGMPASGLLAAGGTALVCGIGWMLSSHLTASTNRSLAGVDDHGYVRKLTCFMVAVVIVTTTLLLMMTTLDFLEVMYRFHASSLLKWVTGTILVGTAGVSVVIAGWRTRRMLGAAPTTDPSHGKLPAATYTIVALSGAGTIFAGVLTRLPIVWAPTSTNVVVAFALVLGAAGPAAVSVLLAMSLPSQH